jgi:hypothetical protein
MAEKSSDSLGPAFGADSYGADVESATIEFNPPIPEEVMLVKVLSGMDVVLEALTRLTETFGALAKAGELSNIALLEMQPWLLSIATNPDFAPRKLKKAYWKLFEGGRVTWREKQKLKKWCRRGNMTLDKLSGKRVDAKTPD